MFFILRRKKKQKKFLCFFGDILLLASYLSLKQSNLAISGIAMELVTGIHTNILLFLQIKTIKWKISSL